MPSYKLLLSIITLIWLCWACTFAPDEVYYEEIDFEAPTDGFVDLFASSDTLYVRDYAVFNNVVNNVDFDKVVTYEYLIDGLPLSVSGSTYVSFSFESDEYEDGYHTLGLRFTLKSGSGSLADILGQEFYQVDFERTILIDNAPIGTPEIISTELESDGSVTIKWKKWEGIRFESYQLEYDYGRFEGTVNITDVNQTSFNYQEFSAGLVRFTLKILAKGEESFPDFSNFSLNLDFTMDVVDNKIKVSWPNPEFDGYIGVKFIIKNQLFNVNSADFVEVVIDDVTTREYVFDRELIFPYKYEVRTSILLDGDNEFSLSAEQFSSKELPVEFLARNMKYFFLNESTYLRYRTTAQSSQTISQVDIFGPNGDETIRGVLALSPDRRGLYGYDHSNGEIVNYDIETLQPQSGFAINDLLEGADYPYAMFVSNDAILAVHFRPSSRTERLVTIDMTTNTVLKYYDFEPDSRAVLLNGGNFIFEGNFWNYLDLETGMVIEVDVDGTKRFHALAGQDAYMYELNGEILIKRIKDSQLVSSFSIRPDFLRVNVLNEELIGVWYRIGSDDLLDIYELATGQIIRTVNVADGYLNNPFQDSFSISENKLLMYLGNTSTTKLYVLDLD